MAKRLHTPPPGEATGLVSLTRGGVFILPALALLLIFLHHVAHRPPPPSVKRITMANPITIKGGASVQVLTANGFSTGLPAGTVSIYNNDPTAGGVAVSGFQNIPLTTLPVTQNGLTILSTTKNTKNASYTQVEISLSSSCPLQAGVTYYLCSAYTTGSPPLYRAGPFDVQAGAGAVQADAPTNLKVIGLDDGAFLSWINPVNATKWYAFRRPYGEMNWYSFANGAATAGTCETLDTFGYSEGYAASTPLANRNENARGNSFQYAVACTNE